jgi:ribonuclease-3
MRADPGILEAALGHRFQDRHILERALTHRSHAHEHSAASSAAESILRHNEQLEFLGDAVLGVIVSEQLVRRFPELSEGRLSKLKAHLVSANHLVTASRLLDLGSYLQIGRGEEMTGGRTKRTLLANALEAVIAAIYLDGGMDAARRVVEKWVFATANLAGHAAAEVSPIVDFKGALQELTQLRKLPAPRYLTIREHGPEHAKTFTVEVRIGKQYATRADGLTKKGAAQEAARAIYERLSQEPAEAI